MAFSFPWLKNAASTSTPNPSPSARNPFLPIQTHLTSFLSSLPFPRPIQSLSSPALGMLCFRREDADMLLAQMDGDMRAGSTVVPVALNKVIQLKSDGVAFRFLPDSSQVANAIKLMQDEGQYFNEGFPGVPVFQSRSLVLMSDNKRYRPVFFRKEDLDNSLHRASRDQQKPNPVVRIGETQVSSLEGIIRSMKDSSSSEWDDAVFIPPGLDLATISKPSHANN